MSTRCVITVTENDRSFSVYRHSDGYPQSKHGVIAQLSEALEYAWQLPRFEADDFAAAIVRAWKQPGGGGIYMTENSESHGDLSYAYQITFTNDELYVKVFTCSALEFEGTLAEANQKYNPE